MSGNKKSMESKTKKKKLKDMTVDEFMSSGFNSDSESSSDLSRTAENMRTVNNDTSSKTKKLKKKKMKTEAKDDPSPSVPEKAKSSKKQSKSKGKKANLANTLKDTDPDFYEYLQGEDVNLLKTLEDLSESDSGSENDKKVAKGKKGKSKPKKENDLGSGLLDMSSGDEDSDDDGDQSKVHTVPEKLEVASDDSEADDLEDDDDHGQQRLQGGTVLTHKMIDTWSDSLRSNVSIKTLKNVVSAFHGAVYEAGGRSQNAVPSKYIIKGDGIFNSIVRLCLAHMAPALQTVLEIPSLTALKQPVSGRNTNNKWAKVKLSVKSYLSDVLQLLSQLSDPVMVNTLLKHIHKLAVLYTSFARAAKNLMKQMIKIWSTSEETSRVLAFLIINKLIQLDKTTFLESSIKKMYMAYVSNCKFVSPNTLPLINFMQRSLVEIFTNDESLSYQYAFIYIRQLAIHLRNAMTVKKKNLCQAVYNWQYVHCLALWVQLLATFPSDELKPLIYPLTQTIIGTAKLLPTARYYPLRFHCVSLLNTLSSKTHTYIPTLPLLLEVFTQTDFNKRHKSVSVKPFNFAVMLKLSKPQLGEKAFKDGVIDQLYEHLMESYNIHAHSVGFPEFIIPSVLQLRDFVKKCKIANYCKQVKQIIEKIEEQSKFMIQRRKRSSLQLDDFQGLRQWEQQVESSPLRTFYTSWRKLRNRELMHAIANKEVVSGAAFEMPSVDRKKASKATEEDRKDFAKLFEDLSDSDSEDEARFLLKEERPKTETKNKKRKREDDEEDDGSDDYSDFDDEELAILDRSASEDDEEEDDDDDDSEDDEEVKEDDEEEIENVSDDDEEDEEDDDMEVDISPKKSKKENNVSNVKDKRKESRGNDGTKNKKKSKSDKVIENGGIEEDDEGDGSDDVVEEFVLSDSD